MNLIVTAAIVLSDSTDKTRNAIPLKTGTP